MGVTQQNRITSLEHELSCLRIKNAKQDYFIRNLTEKVDFYSKLDTKTDFDKGFQNAFEIVKNLMKELNNGTNSWRKDWSSKTWM